MSIVNQAGVVKSTDRSATKSRDMKDASANTERRVVEVERAVSELRAGRPVAIRAGQVYAVAAGVEAIDTAQAEQLQAIARRTPRLLLPAPRLRRLGLDRQQPGAIALPSIDLARIAALALGEGARIDAPAAGLCKSDLAAMELARIALIAPAVVIVAASARHVAAQNFLVADADSILAFRRDSVARLLIVSRAPVPLEDAPSTEFVVFRGGEGMREQVAIIIGKPDMTQPVTVRLHSACLTGDLFGSLKCDCGDQLRQTVRYMAENGGGVLLYLDQEGRGNGIANKIRAYRLQAEGLDTYDADETLGFGHDQRHFDFAAAMLRQIGVTRVRVMTNNPLKIAALEEAGLDVASDQRIMGRLNDHNVRYLASKRDRAGHFIDVDAPNPNGIAGE